MSFQHKYPIDDHTFVQVSRDKENATWAARVMLNLHVSDAPGVGEESYTEVARMLLRSLEPLV